MSARRRRDGAAVDGPGAAAPIQFRLEPATETHVTDEGHAFVGRGYTILDPRTASPLAMDDFFFRIGGGIVTDLVLSDVEVLQDAAFAPGQSVVLVRHPAETSDELPGVSVCDPIRMRAAGTLAPEVVDALTAHGAEGYAAAFCLWEWRDGAGRRVGTRLLLAPGWSVEELPQRATL